MVDNTMQNTNDTKLKIIINVDGDDDDDDYDTTCHTAQYTSYKYTFDPSVQPLNLL